jgi:23S rRNA pseudouridine1911/1915/1917 synthase
MGDLPQLLASELAAEQWPVASPPGDALALPTAAHRIDVPVSGCAVFARTQAALASLNRAFAQNAVEKHYWAIVEQPDGQLPPDIAEGIELVHWIGHDPRRNKSVAYDEAGPGRKKAVLRLRQVGTGRDYLFFEVALCTGRRHQIRAQLERLGLHVKGDLKYGARRSEKDGGIRLHARSLVFPDPKGSGERIRVEAAPPLRDNLWLAFEENLSRRNDKKQTKIR